MMEFVNQVEANMADEKGKVTGGWSVMCFLEGTEQDTATKHQVASAVVNTWNYMRQQAQKTTFSCGMMSGGCLGPNMFRIHGWSDLPVEETTEQLNELISLLGGALKARALEFHIGSEIRTCSPITPPMH